MDHYLMNAESFTAEMVSVPSGELVMECYPSLPQKIRTYCVPNAGGISKGKKPGSDLSSQCQVGLT